VTINEIEVGDPPEAWTAAGFHVDDDGTCRVGSVRIRLVGSSDGRGIRGWSLRGVAGPLKSLDGLPTTVDQREAPRPAEHRNGCLSIDHLVVLTPDNDRTVGSFGEIGLAPRRTRATETDGVPMLQTFFRTGEVIIELVGPAEPAGLDPATFFGLACTVDDLEHTRAVLGEHLGRTKDAVQPGRRIATLRHRDLGLSVATAFMTDEER
jgi:hypothetical protein